MRTRSDVAFWDDEVADLAGTVTELLGEDVVIEALGRAFASLRVGDRTISFDEYRDALKTELRRVVRPQ